MLTNASVLPVRTVEHVRIRLGDTLVSVERDSPDKIANLVRKITFKSWKSLIGDFVQIILTTYNRNQFLYFLGNSLSNGL